MNNKALNHLIVCLSAALISILLTTLSIIVIPDTQVLLEMAIRLGSVFADFIVVIYLYLTIKLFFRHQSKISIITACIATLIIMPLWFASKTFIFEGSFDLGAEVFAMTAGMIDNVIAKLLDPSVAYFSKTLFSEANVPEYLIRYVLSFLADFIMILAIPFGPIVLLMKDLFRGTEVYQFGKADEEPNESKL